MVVVTIADNSPPVLPERISNNPKQLVQSEHARIPSNRTSQITRGLPFQGCGAAGPLTVRS